MHYLLAHLTGSFALLTLLLILAGIALVVSRWIATHGDALVAVAQASRRRLLDLSMVKQIQSSYPRLTRFLGDRLSSEGYLGLHLTIGLLLSVIAVFAFAEVADQMLDRQGLAEFDNKLDDALHAHATPGWVTFYKSVSYVGSVPWITFLGLTFGIFLALKRRRLLLVGWLVALVGGGLLDELLKLLFRRRRPYFDEPFVTLQSWSFPSGHSMGSLIAYGMLAYALLSLTGWRWRANAVVLVLTAVLVILIGFSRLYLGAHYLTDVIGGYAAATVWLSACVTGVEVARRRATNRGDR